MNIMNVLIILGCLAGGYWLVSSIMGPGVDITRREKSPDTKPAATLLPPASTPHEKDWHLILDVPANADRREIDAAYKRRISKAESTGDSFEAGRIRRAYAAATQRPV
jgi:hypothetical protein